MILFSAATRKNPLASKTLLKTLQVATAKWLYGARDREGGHKARMAQSCRQPQLQDADIESDHWLQICSRSHGRQLQRSGCHSP